MRIIGGRLQRRALKSPSGHLTRPTSSRTRESIFNLIESRLDLHDAEILDLFAGTGALGLEAISRGAGRVTFVEQQGRVLAVARENADLLDVADQCWFLRADAVSYLERYNGPPFDVILADPPYSLKAMPRMPGLAVPHLKSQGLFILEHDTRIFFDDHQHLDTSRPYGRTIVTVFTAEPQVEDVGTPPEAE